MTGYARKRVWENFNFTFLGKVKVFPYSFPSVRPGADPGVQAVSQWPGER